MLSRRAMILFLLTALSAELLARAGGGNAFSSGGSPGGFSGSHYSGGGGGGGGAFPVYLLVRLCMEYPLIGVPVVLVILILLIYGGSCANTARCNVIVRRAFRKQSLGEIEENAGKIASSDPGFSTERLVKRAETAFMKIQKAWSGEDMKDSLMFVSDSVRERFSILLDIYKNCGIRNCTENVRIISSELAALEADDFFNTAHVKITASASDYYIERKSGRIVKGDKAQKPFTEIWTFLRKPGVRTVGAGIIENYCPNCGAPLAMSDRALCSSCKAVVNSGEYDWVLTAISQEYEWNYKSRSGIPGLPELVLKDPAFNPAHVEDRASAIFQRYLAARFFADPGYVARLADNAFLQARKAEFRELPDGRRRFPADASAGAVEIVEILPAAADGGNDRLRVKIRWSGHYTEKKVPSLIVPDFGSSVIYNHELVLIRKSGVMTSSSNTLSSIHCPNCGAPESAGVSPSCEYCGTLLNDGSYDWTLHDIVPFTGLTHRAAALPFAQSGEVSSLAPLARASKCDRETLIAFCAAMMLSDGEISPAEMKELKNLASESGISSERLVSIINSLRNNTMKLELPQDHAGAYSLLRAIVVMCLADGKISGGEKAFLENTAARAGYSGIDVEQLVKKERLGILRARKIS